MNERILVNLANGLQIALTVVLLLGWLPAWKARSKGAGNLLWWIYGTCMMMAVLMLFLGNPQFALGDRMRDTLLTGDHSPYATLDKVLGGRGRGMSYSAGCYIAQVDGIRAVAIAYCIMSIWFWRSRFHKSLPEVESKEEG